MDGTWDGATAPPKDDGEPDFRALFEALPGLHLVLDPELRVVAVSNSYLAATRTRREEVLGRAVLDVLPAGTGDDAVNLRASLERVRRHRVADAMAVQRHDVRRPAAQGGGFEVRWWTALNTPVLDDRKRLRYVIHSVEDVTDFVSRRGEASEQTAPAGDLTQRTSQMEAEIVRRSVELQRANRELRAAGEATHEFLSRMSHELRTPLTAIIGFGELLELADLDERPRDWAAMIVKASEHLLDLVNDVLELSSVESGEVVVEVEPVSLEPLLVEVVSLLAPFAESRKVRLHPAPPRIGSGYVLADEQRLKQVLINLVSNAVKYNHPGGEVRIDVQGSGRGCIRIAVEDTGPGLTEAAVRRLFTPFERLDARSSGIDGTGLGLALSRRLAEVMGGVLGVESAPGQGSRFWIELRGGEPHAVQEAADEDQALTAVRHYARRRELLYIEDTAANVRLVEQVLRRRPSVRLLPAMLGRLGVEMAREHHPDLILLDIHLPDLSGDDVLAELKADESTRAIPVVVLSADATRRTLDAMIAGGARSYLTKPIAVRRLLEVIDELLDEQPLRGSAATEIRGGASGDRSRERRPSAS